MKKIVKIKINKDGTIDRVKFEGNSSFTDINVAINLTEKGQIENVHVVKQRDGKKYLRSNPDNKKNNNLLDMTE